MNQMEQQVLFTLSIDQSANNHLKEAAKWARFLAITGMIFLAIALLASIASITILSGNTDLSLPMNRNNEIESGTAYKVGTVIGILMMLSVLFFPLLYLLQFSNKIRAALKSSEQMDLDLAFLNLKRYFRYIGIILIIILGIYALTFLLAIAGRF
jgi:hypothetical protein